MKFFQKTGVAVAITVLAIAAALFIGLSPVLKSGAETAPVQTVSSQDTSAQTSSASLPASEQTASGTAGDETISNKYIRDEAGRRLARRLRRRTGRLRRRTAVRSVLKNFPE